MKQESPKKSSTFLIPVLTTPAGSCLTTANWLEAGVRLASFYLSSLLMKPGYDFLSTLALLAPFVNWQEQWVLNASLPHPNVDGYYTIRSQYDGSRAQYAMSDVWALILRLQPNIVILPYGMHQQQEHFWSLLPENLMPFIPVSDLSEYGAITKPYGIYLEYQPKSSTFEQFVQQVQQYSKVPCYLAGAFSVFELHALIKLGVAFVESDTPASDAWVGRVYCRDKEVLLQNESYANQFIPIDESCGCPTCRQSFTRAYLHHLLAHTPLLCQRFLIQHNTFYCQTIK